MSKNNQSNIFKDFNTSPFKKELPPKNDSEKTKKELEYLSTIDLDKKFFQDKDDLISNFFDFLDSKKVKYDKKQLRKIVLDAVEVILELKNYFKRPRPFKLDHDFKDPLLKSTKGYSYPSGHSTQSNLLSLVLGDLYPKYKKDFSKIVDDIVFSRQMAKAHYPSDIKFGEKLAKSMFKYLKDNNLIKNSLKETIIRILREEVQEQQSPVAALSKLESDIKTLLNYYYKSDNGKFYDINDQQQKTPVDLKPTGAYLKAKVESVMYNAKQQNKYTTQLEQIKTRIKNGKFKEFFGDWDTIIVPPQKFDYYSGNKCTSPNKNPGCGPTTITESYSNLFKRKLYVVDQVIDNVVKQMYSCDYEDANEFFEGVVYDMSWLIRNRDFGLNDVEWLDIYDYLSEFKKEEILQYYTDRCPDNAS
jgi:hypothetical protein